MSINRSSPSLSRRCQLQKANHRVFSLIFVTALSMVLVLASACQSGGASTPVLPTQVEKMTIPSQTFTQAPTRASTPTPSATRTPVPPVSTISPKTSICAPLESFTLDTLPEILTNPFNPPQPGNDDKHHGVDFAFWRYKDRVGMLGLPIFSILDGRVAMVDTGHFPFGNVILVETPLDRLPQNWVSRLNLPPAEPLWTKDNRLYCPEPSQAPAWDSSHRSLYLLYAHMQEPAAYQIGDPVQCGDPIGAVGSTGDSSNDHLHLEVRVGPAGASFKEMNHYQNNATDLQMSNYCTWRVSGIFKMIDPMILLSLRP